MNKQELDILVDDMIVRLKRTLETKSIEYAREDALNNIKRIATLRKCTLENACVGLMAKHIVSLYDMVDDLNKDVHSPQAVWGEKIGDSIIYLFLLDAIRHEKAVPVGTDINTCTSTSSGHIPPLKGSDV